MFGYRCRCVWQEWAHVPRGVVQFHCGSQLLPTGSIAHIAAGDVETNMPSAPIGSEFSNDKARILEMGVQVSDLTSEWEGAHSWHFPRYSGSVNWISQWSQSYGEQEAAFWGAR